MTVHAPVFAGTGSEFKAWRVAGAALIAGLVVLVAGYWATVADMVSIWGKSGTYHHGFLVLPTLAYVLWQWRPRIEAHTPEGSAMGVVLAGFCGVLWLAADRVGAAEGQHIALVGGAGAVFLAGLGRPPFRTALPVLLLLAFLVPTGGQLLPLLKTIALWFGVSGAEMAGLPTAVEPPYRFIVAGTRYHIIDDCAALAELLGTTFLALTLGLLLFRRTGKILAFVGIAAAAAVLVNGLRIITIVLHNHLQGEIMAMSAHRMVGWVAIALAMAMLVAAAHRFRDEPDSEMSDAPYGDDRPARPWRAGAMGVLAAMAMIAAPAVWSAVAPADTGSPMIRDLPDQIGTWNRLNPPPDWRPTADHADEILYGLYADGRREMTVFAALARGPRTEVTGASLDLTPGSLWRVAERRPGRACHEGACMPVRILTLEATDGSRVRQIAVLTVLDGQALGSAMELRLRRAWQALWGRPAEAAAIGLAVDGGDPLSPSGAGAFFTRLIAGLKPHR